jgi:hypothetical protein
MPGGISKLPRTHFGGVQVQTEECAADLKVHDRLLPLSFETGEQASHKVYLSQAARVSALRIQVTKALAATDAGQVELLDSAGVSKGLLSLAAGLALNSEQTMTVTPFTVAAGSFYRLNVGKTTPGGRIQALVTETRVGGG